MITMQDSSQNHMFDTLRNFDGIERSKARRRLTDEDFTPSYWVNRMLDEYPADCWNDIQNVFLDNSCGNGNILAEIVIRKMQSGLTHEQALKTIRGVEFEEDNVAECRERLLCGREDLRPIVEQNIVCADALRYHYRFDGTDPYETEQDRHFSNLFDIA